VSKSVPWMGMISIGAKVKVVIRNPSKQERLNKQNNLEYSSAGFAISSPGSLSVTRCGDQDQSWVIAALMPAHHQAFLFLVLTLQNCN
jgi:hypothetical protein